jgi:hypothetical protein
MLSCVSILLSRNDGTLMFLCYKHAKINPLTYTTVRFRADPLTVTGDLKTFLVEKSNFNVVHLSCGIRFL